MLESVVDGGTGSIVRELGVSGPVAGKTGTTNNGADIWFVGYTPSIVATVWFGYDAPRTISGNASGGRLAAPAWAAFYRNGWRERPGHEDWTPPAGLVRRTIDAFNGDLANEWCPTTQREWFRSGTEPTHYMPGAQGPAGRPDRAVREEGGGGVEGPAGAVAARRPSILERSPARPPTGCRIDPARDTPDIGSARTAPSAPPSTPWSDSAGSPACCGR